MFDVIGRFVTRLPWVVIGLWIVAAVVAGAFAPKLTSTQDNAEFLPSHYESIRAANLQSEAFPDQKQPAAILVFDRTDGKPLTDADSATIADVVTQLQPQLDQAFAGIVAQPPAPNKLVELAVVGLGDNSTGFDPASMDAVKALRVDAQKLVKGGDLRLQITGSAAQSLDSQEASASTLTIVGIVTVVLIVLLLGLIFRSVIICLMPVAVVLLVSVVATGLIGTANEVFGLKADSSLEAILIVVLFGIGTDYILFLLFRYRERLRAGDETRPAVQGALRRAGEAIASAGGAVIVSFMALILSSLSIFRSIGPALAIAVAVTLVAALTLVPAVMTLLGKALFWPSKSWRNEPKSAAFAAIGRSMAKGPLKYALASGGVLGILAIFAFGFSPSFDFTSSLPKGAESTEALVTLQKGLPAGATDPSTILLTSTDDQALSADEISAFGAELSGLDGLAAVTPGPLSADQMTASFSGILASDPASKAAIALVGGPLRDLAHASAPPGTEALVGGGTAISVDIDSAVSHDYKLVFPVAALVIFVILALLLRSLVAPLYMLISVGLGFGSTLGATVIVFQHIQGEGGLIFLLPIYIYLFVVALGTDYNILMIARLREEAREGKEPREAVAEAIKHAAPTVAAAGLILAGTFASLMLGGNSLITSLGFALSFGIFVSAFVMALFFTPAITALLGHTAWWPGHGDSARPGEAPRLHAGVSGGTSARTTGGTNTDSGSVAIAPMSIELGQGTGPLKGVRVVEIAGIGPGPHACMILADLGADVIRIERPGGQALAGGPTMLLNRGRPSVALDLKNPEATALVLELVRGADVVIEGMRPGVTERLGLGPDDCLAVNERIVYGRMTGWGQDGPLAQAAGHDMNYIAITGTLFGLGQDPARPHFPANLVGDFGGGSTYLVIGILAALLESKISGKGQVIDAAIVDGTAHLNAMTAAFLASGGYQEERAANMLDGGVPFYDIYETSDGKHLSVGSLEPQFFDALVTTLGIKDTCPGQADFGRYDEMRALLTTTFATRTQAEWVGIFEGTDACVAGIIPITEAFEHPHLKARGTFVEKDGMTQPMPAPRFSRTQATLGLKPPVAGEHTREALTAWGIAGVDDLIERGVAVQI